MRVISRCAFGERLRFCEAQVCSTTSKWTAAKRTRRRRSTEERKQKYRNVVERISMLGLRGFPSDRRAMTSLAGLILGSPYMATGLVVYTLGRFDRYCVLEPTDASRAPRECHLIRRRKFKIDVESSSADRLARPPLSFGIQLGRRGCQFRALFGARRESRALPVRCFRET